MKTLLCLFLLALPLAAETPAPLDPYGLPMVPGRFQIVAAADRLYKIDTATGQVFLLNTLVAANASGQAVNVTGWQLVPTMTEAMTNATRPAAPASAGK